MKLYCVICYRWRWPMIWLTLKRREREVKLGAISSGKQKKRTEDWGSTPEVQANNMQIIQTCWVTLPLLQNGLHPLMEGNKICKLMAQLSNQRGQSSFSLIFVFCCCVPSLSCTPFSLSTITLLYVSLTNYHFIIFMSHFSLILVLGGEKETNKQWREWEKAIHLPLWAVIHS